MKKLLFVPLLAVLLFSGCVFSVESDEDAVAMDGQKTLVKQGVLNLQTGVYADLPGTHYLARENDKNLPLASLMINLSDSKYLNNDVEVTGAMKENSSGEAFLEVETIEVLKNLGGKAGWEMYKNSDLGVQIAYKANWEKEMSFDGVYAFVAPNNGDNAEADRVDIVKYSAEKDYSLLEALEAEIGSEAKNATMSKIGVDKYDALKITNEDKTRLTYYLKRGEYLYSISFAGSNSSDSLSNKNVFHEMLLDFQFIGFTSSDADESEDASTDTNDVDPATNEVSDNNADKKDYDSTTVNTDNSDDTTDSDPASSDEKSDHSKVLNIIQDNAGSFSNKLSGKTIMRVEFVESQYAYVDYDDGSEKGRYLFKYEFDGEKVLNSEVLATYEVGDTTDWKLSDGSNPIIGKEKTVFIISDENVSSTVVKEGFRYFESTRYGFKLQYPANWYYAGRSDGSDEIVYHYGFSNEPVTDSNEIVEVDVLKSSFGQSEPALYKDINDELQIRIASGSDDSQLRNDIFETIEIIK